MVENRFTKYEDPRELPEESLKPQEIQTYSAYLTNKRLDLLFTRMDDVTTQAWNEVNLPNLQAYFSVIKAIYNWAFVVFKIEENRQIMECFDDYYVLFFGLLQEEEQNLQTCYKILFILDRITQLIIADFQKQGYFFRTGVKETKGIEAALEMLERKARAEGELEEEKVISEKMPAGPEELEAQINSNVAAEAIVQEPIEPEEIKIHETIRDFRELQRASKK